MASLDEKTPQNTTTTTTSHDDTESTSTSPPSDKDIAITLVGDEPTPIDPLIASRTLRKIDRFLMLLVILGYGITFYDKAILGSAALFGMTTDLSLIIPDPDNPGPMDSTRLSWATSLFYFGMVAGLYPMTFALQRFDVGRLLGIVVIIWSGICMLTAAVTTYQELYIQRFFLGLIESIIPVGLMGVVSTYFTQQEQR